MLHTIISVLVGGATLALTIGIKILLSPRFHREVRNRIRDNSMSEMERNLALYEQAKAAKARSANMHR